MNLSEDENSGQINEVGNIGQEGEDGQDDAPQVRRIEPKQYDMSDEEMNEGDVEVGDLGNGEEDEDANGAYQVGPVGKEEKSVEDLKDKGGQKNQEVRAAQNPRDGMASGAQQDNPLPNASNNEEEEMNVQVGSLENDEDGEEPGDEEDVEEDGEQDDEEDGAEVGAEEEDASEQGNQEEEKNEVIQNQQEVRRQGEVVPEMAPQGLQDEEHEEINEDGAEEGEEDEEGEEEGLEEAQVFDYKEEEEEKEPKTDAPSGKLQLPPSSTSPAISSGPAPVSQQEKGFPQTGIRESHLVKPEAAINKRAATQPSAVAGMYASMFREHGHQNPQVNMVDSTIKFLVLSSPEGRSISRNQIDRLIWDFRGFRESLDSRYFDTNNEASLLDHMLAGKRFQTELRMDSGQSFRENLANEQQARCLEAKNNGFMPEDVSERKVTQRVPVRVVKELVDKFAREEIASNSPIEGIIYGLEEPNRVIGDTLVLVTPGQEVQAGKVLSEWQRDVVVAVIFVCPGEQKLTGAQEHKLLRLSSQQSSRVFGIVYQRKKEAVVFALTEKGKKEIEKCSQGSNEHPSHGSVELVKKNDAWIDDDIASVVLNQIS